MNINSVSSYANYSSNARQTNFNGIEKLSTEAQRVDFVKKITSKLNSIKSNAWDATHTDTPYKDALYDCIENSINYIKKLLEETI